MTTKLQNDIKEVQKLLVQRAHIFVSTPGQDDDDLQLMALPILNAPMMLRNLIAQWKGMIIAQVKQMIKDYFFAPYESFSDFLFNFSSIVKLPLVAALASFGCFVMGVMSTGDAISSMVHCKLKETGSFLKFASCLYGASLALAVFDVFSPLVAMFSCASRGISTCVNKNPTNLQAPMMA